MSERLEVTEFCPGVDLYRVFDARVGRESVAGLYDIRTRMFHKFVKTKRGIQRTVNGKPLQGFGIQENAVQHLLARACDKVCIHYAPTGIMHTSDLSMWNTRGLLANYAGRQRFLGILTLRATRLVVEAEKGKRVLTSEQIKDFESNERQMVTIPGLTPVWLTETLTTSINV
ncbi:hypothetical protein LCGC14_1575760 [marine sediment metagenome]|uniref:Uncharacterized protein n=1 Tax=marine sediment metagenome TaxID=412755 RepID=A0A0F9KZA9_9ZZZZ